MWDIRITSTCWISSHIYIHTYTDDILCSSISTNIKYSVHIFFIFHFMYIHVLSTSNTLNGKNLALPFYYHLPFATAYDRERHQPTLLWNVPSFHILFSPLLFFSFTHNSFHFNPPFQFNPTRRLLLLFILTLYMTAACMEMEKLLPFLFNIVYFFLLHLCAPYCATVLSKRTQNISIRVECSSI